MSSKLRLGIYCLTSCEGCAVQALNLVLEDENLMNRFDVYSHLLNTSDIVECDIAFVEGAVITKHDEEILRRVRENSKILVALGSCACLGGISSYADLIGFREGMRLVYLSEINVDHIYEVKPLSSVVRVDVEIPGCPPQPKEIRTFLINTLLGKKFRLPDASVCQECRARGLPCLLKSGIPCLGPITRAGCGALCISRGNPCLGCRGVIEDATLDLIEDAFTKNGLSIDSLRDLVKIYLAKTSIGKSILRIY